MLSRAALAAVRAAPLLWAANLVPAVFDSSFRTVRYVAISAIGAAIESLIVVAATLALRFLSTRSHR